MQISSTERVNSDELISVKGHKDIFVCFAHSYFIVVCSDVRSVGGTDGVLTTQADSSAGSKLTCLLCWVAKIMINNDGAIFINLYFPSRVLSIGTARPETKP
jgi:hypothetical protein